MEDITLSSVLNFVVRTVAFILSVGLTVAVAFLIKQPLVNVLTKLLEGTPPGVIELLGVRGLGPKRARALWQELGVTSPGELQYACLENRLVALPGFGPATQEKLLEAVTFLLQARGRWLVDTAWSKAEEIVSRLMDAPSCQAARTAGELRRGCETIGQIEVVASTTDQDRLLAGLTAAMEMRREEGSRWWIVESSEEEFLQRQRYSETPPVSWSVISCCRSHWGLS